MPDQTIRGWLEDLSVTSISTDEDSLKMQNFLRLIGFPEAVVTVGLAYPDGVGQPVDIHSLAGTLLKV